MLIRFIFFFILFTALTLLAPLVRGQVRKGEKDMSSEDFTIRPPKLYKWTGYICGGFFGLIFIAAALFPGQGAPPLVFIIFFIFILLGAFMVYYAYRWKIRVSGDDIIFSPLFGREKRFRFSDITRVATKQRQMKEIRVYAGGEKIFGFDSSITGFNLFLERLKEKNIRIES